MDRRFGPKSYVSQNDLMRVQSPFRPERTYRPVNEILAGLGELPEKYFNALIMDPLENMSNVGGAMLGKNDVSYDDITQAVIDYGMPGAVFGSMQKPSRTVFRALGGDDVKRGSGPAMSEAGKKYHRYHNKERGYSDVPWMMFAEDESAVSRGYGKYHFTADDKGAVDADRLYMDIADALDDAGFDLPDEIEVSVEDIVNSAGIWDDADAVQVIWDKVLEPAGITKVRTQNGLIVFDEKDVVKAFGEAGPKPGGKAEFKSAVPPIPTAGNEDRRKKQAFRTKSGGIVKMPET